MNPPVVRASDARLARIQAWSGLAFSVFLSLHLLNVMVSVFGPGLYDALQSRIRPLYQFPAYELLALALPLGVHITAGVARIRRRPRRDRSALPLRTRLHRWSAWFILVFIAGHVLATRGTSLAFGVWLGFSGLSFSIATAPWFFYPYYALLGMAGLYHMTHGSLVALRLLGVRVPTPARLGRRLWIPLAAGALLVAVGVLSFGGLLYPIPDPNRSSFADLARDVFGFDVPTSAAGR